MGTANFGTVNYGLPLVAGAMYGPLAESYEKEYGEEYDIDGIYRVDCDDIYAFAESETEEMNRRHQYYTVSIEPGYYEGFYFQVELDGLPWYADTVDDVDDDDVEMYADSREEMRADMNKEFEEIKDWLNDLEEPWFVKLAVSARFSNGETWYTRA